MRRAVGTTSLGHLSRGLFVALVIASFAGTASAQRAGAPSDGFTMELWTELMSPYCPGRKLIDCPSSQAEEMRQRIAAAEAAGRTKEEVEASLLARYGNILLQAPPASGFGLAAYVIPVLALVAGVAIVVVFLRRQHGAAAAVAAPASAPPSIDPELERRIDREMGEA